MDAFFILGLLIYGALHLFDVIDYRSLNTKSITYVSEHNIVPHLFDPKKREASLGQFPSVVFIVAGGFQCGGILIDPSYVLTAAHCLVTVKTAENPDIEISAGHTNIKKFRHQRKASKFYIHEKYKDNFVNDIALIKLQKPFKLSKNIKVAKLPDVISKPGQKVVPVGWGHIAPNKLPEILRYAEMSITINWDCQVAVRDAHSLCAIQPNVTVCYGDSGGPFFLKGTNVVVGVICSVFEDSKTGSCSTKDINIMTDVYQYRDWIKQTMKK